MDTPSMSQSARNSSPPPAAWRVHLFALVLAAMAWSVCTVGLQLRWVSRNAPDFVGAIIQEQQLPDPVAARREPLRVLSPLVYAGAIRAVAVVGARDPIGTGLLCLRALQDLLILLLAARYYRRLGFVWAEVWVGMLLLAWSMTQTRWDPDFGVSAYTQVILVLLVGGSLAVGHVARTLPWIALAAVNHESAFFLPLMVFAVELGRPAPASTARRSRLSAPWTVVALATVAVVHLGARVAYSGSLGDIGALFTPVWLSPGPLSVVQRPWFLLEIGAPLGVAPLLAWAGRRHWPPMVRAMGVAVAPQWIAGYFWAGAPPGAVHLLVPQVLVFVPGALACRHHFATHASDPA